MTVRVEYVGEEALNVALPPKVTCTVASTDPVQRGQVGHPSPLPVSRTTPPVTTMRTLTTSEATASGRSHRSHRVGAGASSRAAAVGTSCVTPT